MSINAEAKKVGRSSNLKARENSGLNIGSGDTGFGGKHSCPCIEIIEFDMCFSNACVIVTLSCTFH